MNKILIIIPTYNEDKNIIKLINEIFSLKLGVDILVVDDGYDNTARLVRNRQQLQSSDRLFLIKRSCKGGRGSAVIEGLKFGLKNDNYDIFIEMDADFSHQSQELAKLIVSVDENTTAIASRYLALSRIDNWPLGRRIFSRLANFYANFILKIGIHDYTNGFRAYHRNSILKLDFYKIESSGYVVLSEIAHQLFIKGVRFIEQPSHFINRNRGASNFSFKDVNEAFISILKIRLKSKKSNK